MVLTSILLRFIAIRRSETQCKSNFLTMALFTVCIVLELPGPDTEMPVCIQRSIFCQETGPAYLISTPFYLSVTPDSSKRQPFVLQWET